MQSKTIRNSSSTSNKSINNQQSIKKHNNKLNGNNLNNSNHNRHQQSNHQNNQSLNLNQPNNVILLNHLNQHPLPPQFIHQTPMISTYIATTRFNQPPTTAVQLPYLNLAYQPNGLQATNNLNAQSTHYISSSNLPQQQHSNRYQIPNNKNNNIYQASRMPNSSPPPVTSSTTASGSSSSQGSSTSCSSASSNCASNNYHLNNNNSNNSNINSGSSQQTTTHSSLINNNNNLNSLSNGKLNNTNSSANNNNNNSAAQTTASSNSNNPVKNGNSNGNLIMSNSNGTSNNNSAVSQQQPQTNSSPTTNGNLNNNNQNGSATNNESTNGTYGEQLSRTNLYIRGLSPSTTDKNLYELCSPFGKIVSTKAIIDKTTNNCKGYGFVDFDSPIAAENAVKQLQGQGIEAQMAKRTDWGKKASNNSNNLESNDNNYNSSDYNLNNNNHNSHNNNHNNNNNNNNHNNHNSKLSQQEQDPTNLYIANLPISMTETDLDSMLNPFGNVISTRILKDLNQQPRGVGFARMESKEKCDLIIQNFNNKLLVGCKEPLLVKFADGGNKKKNQYKNSQTGDSRMGSGQNSVGGWREPNGNSNNGSDQLSPYGYQSTNQQDHHSHHPNPMVAVAAHHAVANSGHQTVAAVHHNGLPTQLISNLPISASIAAYHPHHPNNPHARNHPPYSSAQPISAAPNYPLNATSGAAWMHHHPANAAPHHYQLLPSTAHLQNSQQLAMDPNAALHFMPGLAAQMQQLQLSGHSYIPGNPAYGNTTQAGHIYTTQAGTPLMQQMSLSESADNHPNSTNSSAGPDTNDINQPYNAVYSK